MTVSTISGEAPTRLAPALLWLLGGLAGLGILGCGLGYVITLPAVTPAMLVSGSFTSVSASRGFGLLQTSSLLLYACALLPLNVALSIRHYRTHPVGMIVGACITGVALLLEIFNQLPVLATLLYPAPHLAPPAAMEAYVRQTAWIRFVSFDVASFSMIFAAGLLYAAIFRRKQPLLAWLAVGGVAVFLLHVPFLWGSPTLAVALMGLSICITAGTPLVYARLASE